MNSKYEEAKEILKNYNQTHILSFMNKLDKDRKENLIEQILKIDFEELKKLYEKTFEDVYVDLEELKPITGINPDNLKKQEIEEIKNIATNIIKDNKYAVVTMAGGQGTRLRT